MSALSIQDATSRSVDLAALAQGYSLFFGMTDARNVAVGQQLGMQIAFGGSIFAADNGLPDGENTPHDRALGIMRVAFVDLDRIHGRPAWWSTAPPAPPSFSARVRQVLVDQGRFVLETLTSSDGTGSVRNGATLSNGQWSAATDATTIEAQSAALRVLVEAWFLTHDTTDGPTYRERARDVAKALLTTFWNDPARMFRGQARGADDIVMTPERFGWLQQALRETYQAVWVPGDSLLDRSVLEDRIARVNKLFLNGWDDLNGDQKVEKAQADGGPTECLDARLQLGEQALTGEIGNNQGYPIPDHPPDRESDCVLNIAYTKTASVLAGQVHFHAP